MPGTFKGQAMLFLEQETVDGTTGGGRALVGNWKGRLRGLKFKGSSLSS